MSNSPDDLTDRLRTGLDRGAAPELSDDVLTGAATRRRPHLGSPARTAGIASGATLAVAAVAVGALVAVPALTRPAPLFSAAAPSGAQPFAAPESATSDMRIGWWVQYEYSADPSLSTAGGSGEVYRLGLEAGDPKVRTADLAEALGVTGDVTKAEYSDAATPTWVAGPHDGTGPSLSYNAFGTGDWWYNDPAGSSVSVCDPSVTPEQAPDYGCVLPADAPANLAPTGDAARQAAADLFASTGYEVDAADIEIVADAWGTSANAYLVVDGVRTALGWSAYWANTGVLSYAYGHSVTVEKRGSYGTVSPTAAVDRLADGRWWGSPGPDFQGGAVLYAADLARDAAAPEPSATSEPAPAATDPATTEPAPTDVATEPGSDPTVEPTPAPGDTTIPVDPAPAPTPEIVHVVIDNATPTLLLLWDVDGNAWLVPGYAMQMDEGWWNGVVSLVDGVITLPEPVQIEPDPATY